jgi:hypothetical protein
MDSKKVNKINKNIILHDAMSEDVCIPSKRYEPESKPKIVKYSLDSNEKGDFINCPFFKEGRCSINQCPSKKNSGVPGVSLCRGTCRICCGLCIISIDLCPRQGDMNGVEVTIFKNYVQKIQKNDIFCVYFKRQNSCG